MKKIWLLSTLGLTTLVLAGCTTNCNCENTATNEEALTKAMKYCLENGGTHSLIHSQTATYGECAFPSGIICEDTILWTEECNFEPNVEDIDTEEKRLAGCEKNVQVWMEDMVEDAENVATKWGDEVEGGASFVRDGVITYTKDGSNWRMDAECIADFVDGSISVSYSDEVIDEE